MRLLIVPLVAPLLVGVLPATQPVTEALPRPSAARYFVRFENTVRNDTPRPLHELRCDVLLPEDGPGQRVDWLRFSPHAWTMERDSERQWTASAVIARLDPGDTVTLAWLASVELWDAPETGAADDSAIETDAPFGALGDEPSLCLEDPRIVAAALEIRHRAGSDDPELLARTALEHVGDTVEYELDGGWRPAPEVLEAGTGSCSETAFVFVAICRRLGIPARCVGGTLLRGGLRGRAIDSTFHRLAEVQLPGRGWVRVETTSDGADVRRDRDFARLPRRMLTLSRASSSSGATGLYYHARNTWTCARSDDGARPCVTKRAYWVAGAALPDGGDPLVGLAPGHRPSFARCELLLAETEGFGPPVAAGTLGPSPPRTAPPSHAPASAVMTLSAAGHPGMFQAYASALRHDASGDGVLFDAIRAACEPELADALAIDVEAHTTSHGVERWWATHGLRIVPSRPGRLGLAPAR